jgi:hypothetical protein
MTSYSAEDEKHQWCNACKEFFDNRHWTRRIAHFRVGEEPTTKFARGPHPGFSVEPIYSDEYELHFGAQSPVIAQVCVDVKDRANMIRYTFQEGSWVHGVKFIDTPTARYYYARLLHMALTERWPQALEMLNAMRKEGNAKGFKADQMTKIEHTARVLVGHDQLKFFYKSLPEH